MINITSLKFHILHVLINFKWISLFICMSAMLYFTFSLISCSSHFCPTYVQKNVPTREKFDHRDLQHSV